MSRTLNNLYFRFREHFVKLNYNNYNINKGIPLQYNMNKYISTTKVNDNIVLNHTIVLRLYKSNILVGIFLPKLVVNRK